MSTCRISFLFLVLTSLASLVAYSIHPIYRLYRTDTASMRKRLTKKLSLVSVLMYLCCVSKFAFFISVDRFASFEAYDICSVRIIYYLSFGVTFARCTLTSFIVLIFTQIKSTRICIQLRVTSDGINFTIRVREWRSCSSSWGIRRQKKGCLSG